MAYFLALWLDSVVPNSLICIKYDGDIDILWPLGQEYNSHKYPKTLIFSGVASKPIYIFAGL